MIVTHIPKSDYILIRSSLCCNFHTASFPQSTEMDNDIRVCTWLARICMVLPKRLVEYLLQSNCNICDNLQDFVLSNMAVWSKFRQSFCL